MSRFKAMKEAFYEDYKLTKEILLVMYECMYLEGFMSLPRRSVQSAAQAMTIADSPE